MIGTLAMSGSAAMQVEEAGHGRGRVEHPLVHVDVEDLGPALHLLPGHGQRLLVLAGQDELGEPGRAGDVGALADVHEVRVRAQGQRLEAARARR